MRSSACALLVAALLALPLPHASPTAPAVAQWHYRISIPDPASGNVHVELSIAGLKDVVTRFTFATATHRESVTNVIGGPETPLTTDSSGVTFNVDGDESFSYDVNVERPAFTAGQVLSHSGNDFALFKAESLAIEYRYSYFEGTTFTNQTTIDLAAPAGWNASGPWHRLASGAYELPDGTVLPRGYVVFGKFLATEERSAGGKLVHYVRLGKPAAFEQNNAFYDYIDKATPYYAAVYGPGTHEDVLIVNAPDPMFRGGLGGADSFFVHESADLRTVAHEYAHVFQQFGTDERAGTSSIWINEGDADRHSALSLYAADVWTAQNVNDFFHVAQHDQTDPELSSAVLPNAAYGTTLERFAYHKGAVILEALDELLKRDSGGQVGIGDVLRQLNKIHGGSTSARAAEPVSNTELRDVTQAVLHENVSEFFANFVYGTKWPVISSFVPEGQIVVSDLTLDPARASPGDAVTVHALATNRGTQRIARLLDLDVDDARAQRTNVSLDVGASQPLQFHIVAGAPGDHVVRILDATATLHALTPPRVSIARTSTVPSTPRANQTAQLLVYLRNDGEVAGTARVRALTTDGATLAASTETVVDANSTEVVTLPLMIAQAGALNVTLTLITPQGDSTRALAIDIAPAPPTDEVPGILHSGGNGIPGATISTLVGAALLAAAALARRRDG